jgi:transcription elongation factor Elf1
LRFFDDLTGPAKHLHMTLEACPNCGSPPSELVFKEKAKSNPRIVCKKCGLVISVRNRTNNIKELLAMVAMYSFFIGLALGLLL